MTTLHELPIARRSFDDHRIQYPSRRNRSQGRRNHISARKVRVSNVCSSLCGIISNNGNRDHLSQIFVRGVYDLYHDKMIGCSDKEKSDLRIRLISEVLGVVRQARKLPFVKRIALIGSLTTDKVKPKDADLLVTVSEKAQLAPLAKLGRRFLGHTQSFGSGGEIFLCDSGGKYLGRICHWRRCRPGIRLKCDALNCGRFQYLHDDLKTVCLTDELVAAPPIELWPRVISRVKVPRDVEQLLLFELDDPSDGTPERQ